MGHKGTGYSEICFSNEEVENDLEKVLDRLCAMFIYHGRSHPKLLLIALNSWSLQSNTGTTIAEKLKDAILFALWTVGIALVFFSE